MTLYKVHTHTLITFHNLYFLSYGANILYQTSYLSFFHKLLLQYLGVFFSFSSIPCLCYTRTVGTLFFSSFPLFSFMFKLIYRSPFPCLYGLFLFSCWSIRFCIQLSCCSWLQSFLSFFHTFLFRILSLFYSLPLSPARTAPLLAV